jgi:transposase-like protein
MGRMRVESATPCPHCGSRWVRSNGSSRGKARRRCGDCGKSVGDTYGTAMYHLHTSAAEVGRTLLILMRRGSLRATEEISGHKWETVKDWLLRAHAHSDALNEALVKDLELDEVEVDAFWSFVANAIHALQTGQVRHRTWALTHRNAAASPPERMSPGPPPPPSPPRSAKPTRTRAAAAGDA